jgi:hypothetical protein
MGVEAVVEALARALPEVARLEDLDERGQGRVPEARLRSAIPELDESCEPTPGSCGSSAWSRVRSSS